uniref:Unannotated protein n=1 Tax=freshwater metagenome TaxID=449393 RepID=A0A6J7MG55_9ZZZZ
MIAAASARVSWSRANPTIAIAASTPSWPIPNAERRKDSPNTSTRRTWRITASAFAVNLRRSVASARIDRVPTADAIASSTTSLIAVLRSRRSCAKRDQRFAIALRRISKKAMTPSIRSPIPRSMYSSSEVDSSSAATAGTPLVCAFNSASVTFST